MKLSIPMNNKIEKTNGLSENLEDCIKTFLVDRKAQNLSKGTLYFYLKKTEAFIKFCNANSVISVRDISPELIRNFLLELRANGHNDGGISAFYRTVKTFLLFYEDEFEPENWKNPIRKVKPPRVSIEPLEGIEIDSFHRLVDCCERKSFFGERDRTILLILLETGIRASELCNLTIPDIDFMDFSRY